MDPTKQNQELCLNVAPDVWLVQRKHDLLPALSVRNKCCVVAQKNVPSAKKLNPTPSSPKPKTSHLAWCHIARLALGVSTKSYGRKGLYEMPFTGANMESHLSNITLYWKRKKGYARFAAQMIRKVMGVKMAGYL
jgi:hypothetical protein